MGGFVVDFDGDLGLHHSPVVVELPLGRSISAPPVPSRSLPVFAMDQLIMSNSLEVDAPVRKSSRSNEPSVLDCSNRDESVHSLPAPVRTILDRLLSLNFPIFSSRGTIENLLKLSRSVGEVDMQLDDANASLVAQTVHNVNQSCFPDTAAWGHFLQILADWLSNLYALQGNIWILNANQLLVARNWE